MPRLQRSQRVKDDSPAHVAITIHQPVDNQRPATSKRQPADNPQPTANNTQPTANNLQPTSNPQQENVSGNGGYNMTHFKMGRDTTVVRILIFLFVTYLPTSRASLEDEIREVVDGPHGEEINAMSLRDFIVTLLLALFLRPWLTFATRNQGGQGVRVRGGTTLSRLMGLVAQTGNLGGDSALATRVSGTYIICKSHMFESHFVSRIKT